MARVRRGRFKGKDVKIIQWCNNLIHCTDEIDSLFYDPISLIYTHQEISKIVDSRELDYCYITD